MTHAYDEIYVNSAMIRMGDMLEYATLDLGIEPDIFFKMFLESSYARKFEIGNPTIIAGKSGPEIALLVLDEVKYNYDYVPPAWREERSDVFWTGWAMAYFEWKKNLPFKTIWRYVTIWRLLRMYPTFHEADITKTVDAMDRLIKKPTSKNIAELRISRGWTQSQLADMSGMTVSQLQRLEYGERKTENMTLKTAVSLANALGVDVEELL